MDRVSVISSSELSLGETLDQLLEGNDRRKVFLISFLFLSVFSFKENIDFLKGKKRLKKHSLEHKLEQAGTKYVPAFLRRC